MASEKHRRADLVWAFEVSPEIRIDGTGLQARGHGPPT
jgi:hypothetical protein